MEVLKSAKIERKVSGTAEKGKKVHWRCVVPDCKSNSNVRRHSFPKDVTRSQEWRKIINNPELDELTSDELCYYRVCQLHFPESAYKITSCRQVLRENAVPELNLYLSSSMPRVSRQSTREIALDIGVAEHEKMQVDCTLNNPVNECSDLKIMPTWSDVCVEGTDSPPLALGNTSELHNPPQNADSSPVAENHSSKEPFIASTPKTSKSNSSKKPFITSTPRNARKRLLLGSVTRRNKLTPVAKRLHGLASNLLKKQSKYVHRLGTFKERMQSAEKYMTTVKMKELQSLSKEQLAFVEMHIRNVHKKAKARRFTLDDKVLALAILKQSAQCYRLLSRIFILPTPYSLRIFLRRIPLKPGVNKIIFDHLKKQGESMSEKDKVCFLLWDEVSTDAQVYYDEKEDRIVGFEDWGNARTNRFADHALVFMLRGIKRTWKIPLTYSFCKSSTSAEQLIRCIKELVRAITGAGFKLVATVCDQGQTNASCINNLLKETRATCIRENKVFTGRIHLSGQQIIPLFDPPHLIKGIRNNFLTKDIEVVFPEPVTKNRKNGNDFQKIKPFILTPDFIEEIHEKCKTPKDSKEKERYFASWTILELAYDIDTKNLNNIKKQMPKLTDGHIRKNKIRKMRVNPAAQAVSRTVSSFIRLLTCLTGTIQTLEGEKSMPKKEGVTTSEVVKFFNDSFDSVNGRKQEPKKTRNALRRAVTAKSLHSIFWKEAAHCMAENIRFVNLHTKKPKPVPSLKNFRSTLIGFSKLWQDLQKLNFKIFSPRNVNQDSIENLFGMIRSHGRRNINPTCMQFESSYKSLFINNLTSAKTVKGNCQDDEGKALFSLRNFAEKAQTFEEQNSISTETENSNEQQYVLFNNEPQSTQTDTYLDQSKILMKLSQDVRFRGCCISNFSAFQNFGTFLQDAYSNLEANIPFFCFKKGVVSNLIMPLSLLLDFTFITCTEHFESVCQVLLKLIAVTYVIAWCRQMNRLLKGKDSGARAEAFLSKQARTHYLKKLKKINR